MNDRPEKINLSDIKSRKIDENILNELRDLFEKADEQRERYNFTWSGKSKAYIMASTPSLKTLKPNKMESVDFDKSKNVFISGDNLETLKLLQEAYLNKIDMIYIDPPYNTGKDFVYHDNFKNTIKEESIQNGSIDSNGNRLIKSDKDSGKYHSNWLSMMYPRLRISKNILSDTGAIFVSIDDNEQANLKILMDEIYGQDNFIGMFIVENNPKGRKHSDFISVSAEYVLVYAKNKNNIKFIENIPKSSKEMKKDENGNYVHGSGKRVLVGENKFNDIVENTKSSKHYSVYYNKEKNDVVLLKEENIKDIDSKLVSEGYKRYVSFHNGKFVENTYTMDKFNELFSMGALEFTDEKIFEKNFKETKRIKSIIENESYDAIIHNEKRKYKLEISTTMSNQYLKRLFDGKEVFQSPKSIDLIKTLITLFDKKDMIIMDFFAGSGTTADAVMRLNKEDNGTRKFILSTLDEDLDESLIEANKEDKKNIKKAIKFLDENNLPHKLDYISKERIKRVSKEINDNSGFKAFTVSETGINESVFKKAYNLQQSELLMDVDNRLDAKSDYELLYDTIIESALELNQPISIETLNNEKIIKYDYFGEISGLVAYFGDSLTDDLINKITNLKPLIAVFKESTFDKSSQKVNLLEQFRITSPDTKVKVI